MGGATVKKRKGKIKISYHALQQFCVRTGRSLDDSHVALEELAQAIETLPTVGYDVAIEHGFEGVINARSKSDTFLLWHDSRIDQEVCGVVKNRVVVTILCKEIFGMRTHLRKQVARRM